MSFKREGDDQSQLNLLKKRRVSDLLAEDIPEDEAFLMRSGRYACTVCHHRPVFDTIAMLLVHRNGKRHLSNVKSYYAKKQDFMREVEKRKQLLHLKNLQEGKPINSKIEDVAPLLTKTRQATHHVLLKAAPYKGYRTLNTEQQANAKSTTPTKNGDSFFQRVSRNSHHSLDDLQDKGSTSSTQHSDSSSRNVNPSLEIQTKDADLALLSDKRKETKEVNGSSPQCPRGVGNKLDQSNSTNLPSLNVPLTVLEKKQPAPLKLKPYVPKRLRNKGLTDSNTKETVPERDHLEKDHLKQDHLKQDHLKQDHLKQDHLKQDHLEKDHLKQDHLKQDHLKQDHLKQDHLKQDHLKQDHLKQDHLKQDHLKSSPTCSPVHVEQTLQLPRRNSVSLKQKPKRSEDNVKKSCTIDVDSKKSEREKYLKLASSGWKTDWRGGWIQDPGVEFDSDEETPS